MNKSSRNWDKNDKIYVFVKLNLKLMSYNLHSASRFEQHCQTVSLNLIFEFLQKLKKCNGQS